MRTAVSRIAKRAALHSIVKTPKPNVAAVPQNVGPEGRRYRRRKNGNMKTKSL